MSKFTYHKANSRGVANHGWLKSHHTFSFAHYYNPERINFGVLRVLNDDEVSGGMGFGTHPHENMEIISIPLEGDLEHKDSMGNVTVIKQGDIQVMSAGTGIYHSEYNKNKDKAVKFLQIWVVPKVKNVNPRYDQITINELATNKHLQQILSPNANDEGVWIYQDAWFFLSYLEPNEEFEYKIKKSGNGLYVFVLDGEIVVDNNKLDTRDGLGIEEFEKVMFKSLKKSKSLIMEIPMK